MVLKGARENLMITIINIASLVFYTIVVFCTVRVFVNVNMDDAYEKGYRRGRLDALRHFYEEREENEHDTDGTDLYKS